VSTSVVCPNLSDSSWSILKEAVRSIVGTVDTRARLGFTTAFGTNPAAAGMCPSMQGMLTDDVPPALNNAAAIMAKYDSLPQPPNSITAGVKFESPISASTKVVGQTLGALGGAGEQYILLVTTGQSDYCDDGNVLCPPDSVVWRTQVNKTNGITTLVLGVQNPNIELPVGVLQAFANAGAGEPAVPALRLGESTIALYDQCSITSSGWLADLVASGKPQVRGTTVGTYAAAAGPSRAYTTSASDQAAIAARLKSCAFNLAGSGISVDPTKLNQAHIKIESTEIPLGAPDGWNMPTATQVVLNGASCTTWRTAGNNAIDFQFPCGTIIFQ
jgi:hypothetical protein